MHIRKAIVPVLAVATTVSLFTQLRPTFFGLGELIFLGVSLAAISQPLKKAQLSQFIFTRFWVIYILICLIGAFSNEAFLGRATGTPEQMVFDLGAYLLILLTCFSIEKLIVLDVIRPRAFLVGLFYLSTVILGALFYLSLTTSSLFGYTVSYYTHFSPLAVNVHQTAMYIVALPFLGIVVMSAYSNIQYRIWPAILVMVAITMSVSAETTKADMALVVGFLVFAVSYAVRLAGKSFRIPVGLTVIAVFVAVVLLIDSVALVTEFFQEADTHGARETLYGSSFGVIEASPIVGHGPGAHVLYLGKYWDVHQTQLAILLQAGLLGLIAFLALFWAIAKRVATNPPLLAAFSTILVYSAGGDILRRLPIWILLILIYYWPFSERNSRTRIGGAAPNAI